VCRIVQFLFALIKPSFFAQAENRMKDAKLLPGVFVNLSDDEP
jgi:hypothetical protein